MADQPVYRQDQPTRVYEPAFDEARVRVILENCRDALLAIIHDEQTQLAGLWQGEYLPRRVREIDSFLAGGPLDFKVSPELAEELRVIQQSRVLSGEAPPAPDRETEMREWCVREAERGQAPSKPLRPMKQYNDLDSVTRCCPCGATLSFEGPSATLDSWVAEHRPHCNGKLEMICTDDGARACSTKPAPYLTDL